MKTRQRLNNLRGEIVAHIKDIVNSVGGELYITDFSEGDSPILQEDPDDENNIYTLDKLEIQFDKLYLDGSSSYANFTWTEDNLSIDALVGVAEFLDNYEEGIKELKED